MNKFVYITLIIVLIIIASVAWINMSASVNQSAIQNLSTATNSTAPAATTTADDNLPPATDNMGYMDMSSTTMATSTTTTTTPFSGLALSTVANDEGATPETFTVKAGTEVALTFHVNQTGTYHGGLDFESSVVDSGTIVSGQSGTVDFTATKSFSFIPYWPASNIRKNYTIDIIVQ